MSEAFFRESDMTSRFDVRNVTVSASEYDLPTKKDSSNDINAMSTPNTSLSAIDENDDTYAVIDDDMHAAERYDVLQPHAMYASSNNTNNSKIKNEAAPEEFVSSHHYFPKNSQ